MIQGDLYNSGNKRVKWHVVGYVSFTLTKCLTGVLDRLVCHWYNRTKKMIRWKYSFFYRDRLMYCDARKCEASNKLHFIFGGLWLLSVIHFIWFSISCMLTEKRRCDLPFIVLFTGYCGVEQKLTIPQTFFSLVRYAR